MPPTTQHTPPSGAIAVADARDRDREAAIAAKPASQVATDAHVEHGSLYRLQWDHRRLTWHREDQVEIDVPMIGWFTPADFSLRLSEALTELWVRRSAVVASGVRSVAAHVAARRGRRWLRVLVTFEAPVRGGSLDEGRLRHDIAVAIAQCAARGSDRRPEHV